MDEKINNIEMQPLLNSSNNIDTNCVICLLPNDSTSKQLHCKCKNLYHHECIIKIIKSKTKNCPLCRESIQSIESIESIESNEFEKIDVYLVIHQILIFLVSILYIISFFTTAYSIIQIMNIVFNSSELKYCDNIYKKCEYHSITGQLYKNNIEIKYQNFNVEYELSSSYFYILNNKNYTCNNLILHKYATYDESHTVSLKSIGTSTEIYYNDKNHCLTEYKWFNPKIFKTQLFSLFVVLLYFIGVIMYYIFNYLENIINFNYIVKNIYLIIRLLFILIFCNIFVYVHMNLFYLILVK